MGRPFMFVLAMAMLAAEGFYAADGRGTFSK